MKQFLILVCAFLTALVLSELCLANCVGYPTYGVDYKASYRVGGSKWTNIRKPYAKIYNVEGKVRTETNNIGLPGVDLESLENPIAILGSSFIEALQYKPEEIASSIFYDKLKDLGFCANVLNLGCSGHDPYDSWFRLKYYEQKIGITFSDVILVINSDNEDWFSRHPKPLSFELSDEFGGINDSKFTNIGIFARNASSLIEVLYKGLFKGNDADIDNLLEHKNEEIALEAAPECSFSQEMIDCLNAYKRDYNRFKVLSIAADSEFNTYLTTYCRNNDIPINVFPLSKPKYMIGGAGHLNQEGNKALAEALMTLWQTNN